MTAAAQRQDKFDDKHAHRAPGGPPEDGRQSRAEHTARNFLPYRARLLLVSIRRQQIILIK